MKKLLTLAMALASTWCLAQPDMAGFEYWFDQNDGARVYVPITAGGVLDEGHSPSVAGLAQGTHRINYRMRDTEGQWSTVLHRWFTIHPAGPHQIVALRYWSEQVQNDPTDLVVKSISSPTQVLDIMLDIDLCMQEDTGITAMFYQLRDNHGQWSSVLTRTVDVDAVGVGAGPASINCDVCGNGIEPNTDYTFVAIADGASQYDWTFPAGWTIVSGQGEAIVIATSPADPTSGSVFVSPSNVCGDGIEGSILLSPTSVMGRVEGATFNLYPNPAAQQVFIEMTGRSAMEVTLFSSTGQQLGGVQRFATGAPIQLEVGDLANGTYIIQVHSDLGFGRARFTVFH